MISVQYSSDLHLDQLTSYSPTDFIYPKSDILILAGDICHISRINHHQLFFKYISNTFQYVIYVPGNHEFYSYDMSITELEDTLKNFLKNYPNIFYLNNSSIFIEDILFTGSTLWCNPQNDPPNWFRINLSKEEVSYMYNKSVQYLNKISSYFHLPHKHVMITHYPPIYIECKKKKEHHDRKYDEYYQNKNIDLPNPPSFWIFGHIHENFNQFIGRTCYLSNQRKDKKYQTSSMFNI